MALSVYMPLPTPRLAMLICFPSSDKDRYGPPLLRITVPEGGGVPQVGWTRKNLRISGTRAGYLAKATGPMCEISETC